MAAKAFGIMLGIVGAAFGFGQVMSEKNSKADNARDLSAELSAMHLQVEALNSRLDLNRDILR